LKIEHTSLRHDSDNARKKSDVEYVSGHDTLLGKVADSKLLDILFLVIYQHVHKVVVKDQHGLWVDLTRVENFGLL